MRKLRLQAPLRKVGNSLAFLVPAGAARRGGLHAGQVVVAEFEARPISPLGLLADGPYEEYQRRRERVQRDRL